MTAHPVPVLRKLPWRTILAWAAAALLVALAAFGIRSCVAESRRVASDACAAIGGKVIDYRSGLGGDVVSAVCRVPAGLRVVDLVSGCLTVDEDAATGETP